MQRRLVILSCVLAASFSTSLRAELIDRVLATVGPRVITLSDARAVTTLGLVEAGGSGDAVGTAVQRLIDRTLILEEVDRYAPPEPSAAAIEEGLAVVRARFASPAALDAAIAAAGIDRGAVREWVRNDLRIDAYIAQRFAGVMEPSAEEIEAYIAQHASEIDPQDAGAGDPAVQRAAKDRVVAMRREALLREWLEGLRRRAQVSMNPPVANP